MEKSRVTGVAIIHMVCMKWYVGVTLIITRNYKRSAHTYYLKCSWKLDSTLYWWRGSEVVQENARRVR